MNDSATRLELDKIFAQAAEYAVLEGGRALLVSTQPTTELAEAKRRLALTEEATALLFACGAGKVEQFPPCDQSLERAEKGSTLSPAELLSVAKLLRAARIAFTSVRAYNEVEVPNVRELTAHLLFDRGLEEDIARKIVNENELSDHASARLFELRAQIRLLGERIRAKLSGYLAGEERKFLQDAIVTVRGDRFVVPVKAEYKRSIRGFVHDRSQSGATVFIEPEEVLEMNNELRSLMLDEREEIERILAALSREVGGMRAALDHDVAVLCELDSYYARAEYGYRLRSVKPQLNANGVIEIVKGRHPLLDPKTAVPVTLSVGEKARFLLISGANTGGKTVTLKMCGLFALMGACGFFLPAAEGTQLAIFDGVWCDVGDSQSIEENLSTFSSHIVKLKEILECASARSLVLIDEPGGGTDPEEGAALAQAVLYTLLQRGCRGIVTTHYSALKEFAYGADGIENGCMEFDSADFKPLYRLKIGAPGSSNALLICTRLGLSAEIVERAKGYLSEGARSFAETLHAAEESRVRTEAARKAAEQDRIAWEQKLAVLAKEEEKFRAERERFFTASKAEARRIVAERTAEAEELLAEMEKIFQKENYSEADLIRARTLKNKMANAPVEAEPVRARPVDAARIKAGDRVLVGSMNAEGTVLRVEKSGCEVQVGALKVRVKMSDLFCKTGGNKPQTKERVQVTRNLKERPVVHLECNVIGMTTAEALPEVEAFLDGAVLANLPEVRIIHGMGTGKLRAAIHELLKRNRRVAQFRLGKYGEGESGVTIVTFK